MEPLNFFEAYNGMLSVKIVEGVRERFQIKKSLS